ncbi:hypothetical protein C6501_06315 [Candidatus Poribacteria bacterium]|nr:MAG: hypothetical protein C6501_06315 [Candidatus Poribacteria bacterium]
MEKRRWMMLIFVISLIVGSLAAYFSYNILSESEFFKSISGVFSILGFVGFVIALWIVVRYYRRTDNEPPH